jgi:DNA-binding IscR family transcriptional regulator
MWEQHSLSMKPKYAPQKVLEILQQLTIETNEVRYWSIHTISACTDIPYKQCQQILQRFWADGLVERKTQRGGVKFYCLKV